MKITELTDAQLEKVSTAQNKCWTALGDLVTVLKHYELPSDSMEDVKQRFANSASENTNEIIDRYNAKQVEELKQTLGL